MINLHSKTELEKLTITQLIEILYQLDWNGSWEDIEDGQEPLTNEDAINYVLSYVNDDSSTEWYVDSDLKLFHRDISLNIERVKSSILIEVEKSIEYLFYEIHQKFNTKSGDITPEQSERLIQLKGQLAELMTEQTIQNL